MKTQLVRLIPTILLILVAVNQLRLSHTQHLSAWKGGGFGMFATTDGGPSRYLRLFAIDDGAEFELDLPPALDELGTRAKELPTDAFLGRLVCGAVRELGVPALDQPDVPITYDAFRIEVWRSVFAADDLTPEQELIARYQRDLSERPCR
ncbi:MAG: hypothetical protein AAGD38_18930 [Acidobacteriota bacterium]